MSPSRKFQTERIGDTLVIVPGDALGSLSIDDLANQRSRLIDELRDSGISSIVVDFSNVEYFGSYLLDTLCVVWKQIRQRAGTMSLCGLSEVAQEIINKSRLNSLWTVYPTREAALDPLGESVAPTGADSAVELALLERAGQNSQSRLQVLETGDRTVVAFGGGNLPADHVLGRYLREITQLIDDHHCREFAFDMTGISTVPSGFLGLVATVLKRGVEVSVRNPSEEIREAFALVNFDRRVKLSDTE